MTPEESRDRLGCGQNRMCRPSTLIRHSSIRGATSAVRRLDQIGRAAVASVLAYVALLALLRVSGKRTLAKMNARTPRGGATRVITYFYLPTFCLNSENQLSTTTVGWTPARSTGLTIRKRLPSGVTS